MDSQHRHELAENELAHWLEDFIEKVKPFASLIVIGVIGAVVLFTAWGYYLTSSAGNQAAEWSLYTTTMLEGVPSMNALETASTELDGAGAPADFASITWAEGKLYEASENVLTDRDKALEASDKARQEFERLLLAKGVQASIRNRAQFGLARSYELDGDFDKAIDAYKETTGAFAELAAKRAEKLGKEGLQDDLQWLAAAQAPAFSMPSGPGVPGQQPEFSPDDLDLEPVEDGKPEADVTLDDLLESYKNQAEPDSEGEMATEGEMAEEEEEEEEGATDPDPPADADAAEDGPAIDETPADETPADAAPSEEDPSNE